MFDIIWNPKIHFRKNFRDLRFAVFDFETTGVDVTVDRIVQATFVMARIEPDRSINIESQVDRFVNPGIPIPEEASRVHRIYDSDVINKPKWTTEIRNGVKFGELWFDYLNKADVIVGYNIRNFDIPLLYNELLRCGVDPDSLKIKPYIDLIYWYREWNKKMSDAKQRDAAAKLGCGGAAAHGEDGQFLHNALTDVKVCASLLAKMSVNVIPLTTIREVWDQELIYAEKQNAYLEKKYGKKKK